MSENNYFQFEPRFNDFGDKYHLSDTEVYADIDEAVRNVRRKYRSYSEYVCAINTIGEYLEKLIEKYGGMENFKMAIMLKNIKEFIPPIPRFRNTYENKLLHKYGGVLSEQVFDVDLSIDDETLYKIENDVGEGFDYVYVKDRDIPFEISSRTLNLINRGEVDTVARDLDLLQTYKVETSKKKKGKKYTKKSHLNALKKLRKKSKKINRGESESISELISKYNNDVSGISELLEDHEKGTTVYRGVVIPKAELEEIQVVTTLQRAGILPKDDFSVYKNKSLRKRVKDEVKNKKKSKKKKKKKGDSEDISGFVDSYIDGNTPSNFKAFEKEMAIFNSTQMYDAMD